MDKKFVSTEKRNKDSKQEPKYKLSMTPVLIRHWKNISETNTTNNNQKE